jgi:hypothetical protein
MSKISLALVAVVLTGTFASSLIVRAQSGQRFDYVRVTPYMARIPVAAGDVQERIGLSGVRRANQCMGVPRVSANGTVNRTAAQRVGEPRE